MNSTHDFLNDDNTGRGRSRRKQSNGTGARNALIAALIIAATSALAIFLWFKYSGHGTGHDETVIESDNGGLHNQESKTASILASDTDTLAETGKYTDLLADKERMANENCYPLDDGGDGVITIRFAGDLLLDDSYAIASGIRQRSGGALRGEDGFDESILKLMRDADIFMINNEFTYTSRGTPTKDKQFTFRANPENVSFLNDIGADIVTLANNHAYDYGEVSIVDSMETLKSAGIIYAGAGHDLAEASSPVYYVSDNLKLAIIASTQIERMPNPDTKGATADAPGVFRSADPSALAEAIRQAKEVSDLVIVYTHWGTEGKTDTDWSQNEQAPIIAEAGADLIIGSHPHVLQKIAWQDDTPVFYSLGNYLFNSKTLDTGLAEVNIDASDGSIISLRFVPAVQSGCRTFLPSGEDYDAAIQRMRGLSPDVVIDDEGYITRTGAGS